VIRTALFWDITRRLLVITDVSGQHIASIFRCQESRSLDLWKLDLILLIPFLHICTSCFYIVLSLYVINLCTNYVHMFVLSWSYITTDLNNNFLLSGLKCDIRVHQIIERSVSREVLLYFVRLFVTWRISSPTKSRFHGNCRSTVPEILKVSFLSPTLLRSFACAHYSIKRPKLTSSGIQTALLVKLERRKKCTSV
jgi:hypothetical protein